jgi:hypothetical protein
MILTIRLERVAKARPQPSRYIPGSIMPQKRSSVSHAENSLGFEKNCEQRARNFAFENNFEMSVSGIEVYIQIEEQKELLCVADDPKHLWHTTWRAMCKRFPALKRYTH